MKFNALHTLLLLGASGLFGAAAQSPVPAADLMRTGVYYYPEHWDRGRWERDFRKMAELGFEFTHFGEFAWARMEPAEGRYDFAWLDEAVALAARHGIKVILCTPTPTPPVWLTEKHPDWFIVNDAGLRAEHGGRNHVSYSHPGYREHVEKIVTALAKRYGNDPRVWGWQLDNEPSHYGIDDYSPAARKRFAEWLQAKYGTVENLNRAWGLAFWSQTLQRFDQAFIPSAKTNVPHTLNNHAQLDFRRFSAYETADFLRFQARILRKHVAKNQWITSNFIHSLHQTDPWLNDPDFDLLTHTIYPQAGAYVNKGGVGEQGFRLSDPYVVSYANDKFRYKKGVTGTMELQAGQLNWGQFNPMPLPGAMRAWLWNSFVAGSDFVCTYRFEAPIYGKEQYNRCIVGPDGETLLEGGREYRQFMQELKALRAQYTPNPAEPRAYAQRRAAILWNLDNHWDIEHQPQTNQWNSNEVLMKYYNGLKRLGVAVDFVSEDMDFSAYNVLVAPYYQLLDPALVAKWKRFVENGGHLVLTARTGQKDRDGHIWRQPYGASIADLTGCTIDFFDLLPANRQATVTFNGQRYAWNNWGEALTLVQPTATALVTHADQFYAGKPAAVRNRLGRGTATYIGLDTDGGELERHLLKNVYETANLPVQELPEGLVLDWRDGFWVAINYHADRPQEVPIPATARILVGQRTLPPAGVVVWQER